MRNLLTAMLTAGALLGAAGGASAGTATTTFTVTATVNTNCKVSAAPITFNYTPGLGDVTNSSPTVTVNCTKGTAFNTALTPGLTTGSNIAQRLLNDGAGNTLQYNLYTSSALTTPWGITPGTDTVAGTGGGKGVPAAVTQTVYFKVVDSANQGVPPGTYSDTITVNVNY